MTESKPTSSSKQVLLKRMSSGTTKKKPSSLIFDVKRVLVPSSHPFTIGGTVPALRNAQIQLALDYCEGETGTSKPEQHLFLYTWSFYTESNQIKTISTTRGKTLKQGKHPPEFTCRSNVVTGHYN